MTLDELIVEVGGPNSVPHVEICRHGNGLWTAYFQIIEVVLNRDDPMHPYPHAEQPFFEDKDALEALKKLITWLRGKSIRRRQVGNGIPGPWVDVPQALEVPRF